MSFMDIPAKTVLEKQLADPASPARVSLSATYAPASVVASVAGKLDAAAADVKFSKSRIYKPENLKRAAAAYADCINSNFRVLSLGDSTTYGIGADATQTTNDATGAGKNYPDQLRVLLEKRSGTLGGQVVLPNDTRVTTVAGTLSNLTGPLGSSKRIDGATGEMQFPALPATEIDVICWWDGANSTAFTYSIDGAAPVQSASGTVHGNYYITTITGLTDGPHSITLKPFNTAKRVVVHSVTYRRATGPVVSRVGLPGGKAQDAANGFGAPANEYLRQYRIGAVNAFRPHLTIIGYGINEQSAANTVAGYKTQMQNLINVATTPAASMTAIYNGHTATLDPVGGSVLILSGPHAHTVGANGEQAYWDAAKALADENPHVAWLNLADYFGTSAEAHTAGIDYQLPTSVHSYSRGYGRYANAVMEALEAA